MRIVFMGSADIACPCLAALAGSDADVLVAAVTRPDRPKGRGLKVASCPSRDLAERLGVRVMTPRDVNDPGSVAALRELAADLFVVVAYRGILREGLLSLPPGGCVNVHFSLLPRYRGAAPVQWAIAGGDVETGVTTMYMDAGVDTGDIILQETLPIDPDDTGGSLGAKLAEGGAELLVRTLDAIRCGTAPRIPQDPALATRARKLQKADGTIDWTRPAVDLHNRIRAFDPWPGCYCEAPAGSGRRLRVVRSRATPDEAGDFDPGEICRVSDEGPVIQTGRGVLCLVEVQPAGKRRMGGVEFLHGHRLAPGDRLG